MTDMQTESLAVLDCSNLLLLPMVMTAILELNLLVVTSVGFAIAPFVNGVSN